MFGNLIEKKQQYSNTNQDWLKMEPGTHTIRICPAWSNEGVVTRMIVNHRGYKDSNNNNKMPLCFNYAFNEENILKALWNLKVIKQPDFELFKKVGCIYCKISDALRQLKGKDEANKSTTRPQYLWNVILRSNGKLFKYSTNSKFLEFVMGTYNGIGPQLFDINSGYDMMITATGVNLQRRYNYALIPSPCPLFPDGKQMTLFNLDEAMSDGYTDINKTMELLVNSYPDIMKMLGVNPAEWMTNSSNAPF